METHQDGTLKNAKIHRGDSLILVTLEMIKIFVSNLGGL